MSARLVALFAGIACTLSACTSYDAGARAAGTHIGGGPGDAQSYYGWVDSARAIVRVGPVQSMSGTKVERATEFAGFTSENGDLVFEVVNDTAVSVTGLEIELDSGSRLTVAKAVSAEPLPFTAVNKDGRGVFVSWDPDLREPYRKAVKPEQEYSIPVFLRITNADGTPASRQNVRFKAWWTVGVANDLPVSIK